MGLGCMVGGETRWWGLCGSAFCQVVLLSRLIAHSCGNNCYSFLRYAPCFSPLVFFSTVGGGMVAVRGKEAWPTTPSSSSSNVLSVGTFTTCQFIHLI